MTQQEAARVNQLRANGLEKEAQALEAKFKLEDDKKTQILNVVSGDFNARRAMPVSTNGWLELFVTADPSMVVMKDEVRKWAPQPDPILICGETGTGKELIARALHNERAGKFKAINCAAMPKDLIESELFGHTKGSFTGAAVEKEGLLSDAKAGTVFLDEIGELPLEVQAKFLRALQERMIRKVGSNDELAISCRFIAATHCDLDALVKAKQFREDLYWRLSTGFIRILPLSVRHGDADLIAQNIDKTFPAGWFSKYQSTGHALPGNVRSVQQIVRRWQVLGALPDLTVATPPAET